MPSGKVLICPNLSVKSFFPIGKDQRQTGRWITKKYIQPKYTNLPIVVLDDYYVGKRVLSICKASAAVSIANLFSFCNVNFMRRVCGPQWNKMSFLKFFQVHQAGAAEDLRYWQGCSRLTG